VPQALPTEKWTFVAAGSPQWRAWKRCEAPGGRRWAFRYRDPQGHGMGCDVPSEWPPGYQPVPDELTWMPAPKPDRGYQRSEPREYLLPLPGKHIGRFENYDPGQAARRALKLQPITQYERDFHDACLSSLNPCRAGPFGCSPWLRDQLDHMAIEIAAADPGDTADRRWNTGT